MQTVETPHDRKVGFRLEEAFCVETLEDALARHGKPDIFNTDQGLKKDSRP